MMTYLMDTNSGTELLRLNGDRAAFTPDGKNVATVDYDTEKLIDTIILSDASSGREIQRISDVFTFPVISDLDFSPDGKLIAVPGFKNITVHLIDIQDPTKIRTIQDEGREDDSFTDLVLVSPDNKKIAVSDYEGLITLWDLPSGEVIRRLGPLGVWTLFDAFNNPLPRPSRIDIMAFSRDGSHLAAGLQDQTVRVWDTTTWLEVHTFTGHRGFIEGLDFSPDGKTLISASSDRTIKLWDITAPGN
jgi:WD40 repeat protein